MPTLKELYGPDGQEELEEWVREGGDPWLERWARPVRAERDSREVRAIGEEVGNWPEAMRFGEARSRDDSTTSRKLNGDR